MFVIELKYVKPIEVIDGLLTSHREFLDKYYANGSFLCSGPQNPHTGGLILCRAENRSKVESIIEEDPFHQNQAAEYRITEFELVKSCEGFPADY